MAHCHTVRVDLTVYSLDSIKRAAYRLTDRFALDLRVEDNTAMCDLIFDEGTSAEAMEQGTSQFRKELLDQDLRTSINHETAAVRNLILAHAFSKTGLIGDESVPTA